MQMLQSETKDKVKTGASNCYPNNKDIGNILSTYVCSCLFRSRSIAAAKTRILIGPCPPAELDIALFLVEHASLIKRTNVNRNFNRGLVNCTTYGKRSYSNFRPATTRKTHRSEGSKDNDARSLNDHVANHNKPYKGSFSKQMNDGSYRLKLTI